MKKCFHGIPDGHYCKWCTITIAQERGLIHRPEPVPVRKRLLTFVGDILWPFGDVDVPESSVEEVRAAIESIAQQVRDGLTR